MRRCRFDTLGTQTSAHLAGGPTPYKGWVPPARWVSAGAASPGPPTAQVGLQPTRTVGGVHPPCERDISPPARWVGLFPAHNSKGLLLIDFSPESGPPTARAGCHPARTVGGPGDAAAALTHRAGGTHPVYGVGPPARWAEVYFPTGINLGQCSART